MEPTAAPAAPAAPEPALPAPAPPAPVTDPEPVPIASRVPATTPIETPTPAISPARERPPADFVFESPRSLPRPLRPVAADAVPTAPPATAPPTEPTFSPRRDWAPIDPDPNTHALVAAVQWTASEPSVPHPPVEPATRHHAPPATVSAAPPPAAPPPAAASPSREPEQVTGVHIGSIEVEIVSPPEVPQAEPDAAALEPPRDSLTGRLFSHYGLRQR